MNPKNREATQRILVLGGSGLLGQALIRKILKLYNYKIIIVDLNSPPQDIAESCRVQYVCGDILALDNDYIGRLLNGVQAVFYKIGILGNPSFSSDIDSAWDFLNINAFSLNRIMPLLAESGVNKIIVDSSIAAVSDYSFEGKIKEKEYHGVPTNFYGLSKAILEDICITSHTNYGVDTIIIRYPRVYGPHQNSFINIFSKKIVDNEPIRLVGDPDKVMDIIHIDDATEVALRCLDYTGKMRTFHAAYGYAYTLREIAEMVVMCAGEGSVLLDDLQDSCVPREPSKMLLEDTYTTKELGVQYSHSVDDIIQEAKILAMN